MMNGQCRAPFPILRRSYCVRFFFYTVWGGRAERLNVRSLPTCSAFVPTVGGGQPSHFALVYTARRSTTCDISVISHRGDGFH